MTHKILVINGPNLEMLGKREKNIYGDFTLKDLEKTITDKSLELNCEVVFFQSNIEGEIIDKLHEVGFSFNGVILNAGAYIHTSVAIGDAIKGIETPIIEVRISNVHVREEFRHVTYIAPNAKGVIAGFGLKSYDLAIESFCNENFSNTPNPNNAKSYLTGSFLSIFLNICHYFLSGAGFFLNPENIFPNTSGL